MDTIIYRGTFNGWPVEYRRTYSGGVNPDGSPDMPTRDDLEGAIAFLEALGVKPPAAPVAEAAPAATPAAGNGGAGSQWVCPIHGAQKVRDTQYGRECSVHTPTKPDYPHRTWTGRQGQTMYTCAAKEPRR